MNKQSAALLSILSQCDPQDTELAHESKIQQIMHMDEYIELRHRSVFSPQFEQFYTVSRLHQYSDSQLDKLMSALPIVPEWLENILYSLKNGAAPSLTSEDRPDFFSKDKMVRVSAILEENSYENYTNIKAEEYMSIFDSSTVKSIKEHFNQLPANLSIERLTSNCGSEIDHIMGSTKYCISKGELGEMEAEYQRQIEALQEEIKDGKSRARRRRLFKTLFGITVLFIPSFIGSLTGAISPSAIGMCTLIEFILVLIYWIWG